MTDKFWNTHPPMTDRGGLPLRPPEEAVNIMYRLTTPFLHNKGVHRYEVVLLGVTPEIVELPWPDNVNLRAFDQSAEMIAALWHPNSGMTSAAEQACWESMPVNNCTVDVILGDGCTTQLPDKRAYQQFFAEMARILYPTGKIVMRCFIRPPRQETFAQVAQGAFEHNIMYFGSLKWRIAMALANQQDDFSIRVTDILDTFNSIFPNRAQLAESAGWPLEMVDTIDRYNGLSTYYTFPTMNQLEQLIKPWFMIADVQYGKYELADCCPIVLLRKV